MVALMMIASLLVTVAVASVLIKLTNTIYGRVTLQNRISLYQNTKHQFNQFFISVISML